MRIGQAAAGEGCAHHAAATHDSACRIAGIGADFYLHETILVLDLVVSVILIIGTVLAVVFGSKGASPSFLTLPEIIDIFQRSIAIAGFIAFGCVCLINMTYLLALDRLEAAGRVNLRATYYRASLFQRILVAGIFSGCGKQTLLQKQWQTSPHCQHYKATKSAPSVARPLQLRRPLLQVRGLRLCILCQRRRICVGKPGAMAVLDLHHPAACGARLPVRVTAALPVRGAAGARGCFVTVRARSPPLCCRIFYLNNALKRFDNTE